MPEAGGVGERGDLLVGGAVPEGPMKCLHGRRDLDRLDALSVLDPVPGIEDDLCALGESFNNLGGSVAGAPEMRTRM